MEEHYMENHTEKIIGSEQIVVPNLQHQTRRNILLCLVQTVEVFLNHMGYYMYVTQLVYYL